MEVVTLILLLVTRFALCTDIGAEVGSIPGVEEAKNRAIHWLKSERNKCGWEDTVRAVTALMLVEEGFERYEKQLYIKELVLTIVLEMSNMNPTVEKIALSINALVSICRNPKSFHNVDLISTMENLDDYHLSAVAMGALCIANSSGAHHHDVIRGKVYRPVSGDPKSIDEKALWYIVAACALKTRDNAKLQKNISEMLTNFEVPQREDGSFGSIYRTALITQAYLANGVFTTNISRAVEFLVENQSDNGSFGNVMSTYLVLPILAGKTLADISGASCKEDNNCRESHFTTKRLGFGLKFRQLTYQLSVRDDSYIRKSVVLDIPSDGDVNLLDVMKMAASIDDSFRFEYTQAGGETEVYSIGNWSNDPELSYYWNCNMMTYNSVNITCTFGSSKVPREVSYITFWYKLSRN